MSEVEDFRRLKAEKAEAKGWALAAVGAAKLAEHEGRNVDAETQWGIVAEYGLEGVEGEKMRAMQELADSYVTAHPELFVLLEAYATPGAQEGLVKMVGFLKHSGMEDEAALAEMFELARFERQQIGVAAQPQLRLPGGRS